MKKTNVNIMIVTPYLTGETLKRCQNNPFELLRQRMYGLEEGKLLGKEVEDNMFQFNTRKHRLYINARDSDFQDLDIIKDSHMLVTGCTIGQEGFTRALECTGIPIARYSSFYGGRSEYTNRSAEKAGYAFDVPKNYDTINTLFASEEFLEALFNRREDLLRRAISNVNRSLKEPILCTPYLSRVLAISPEERAQQFAKIGKDPQNFSKLIIEKSIE